MTGEAEALALLVRLEVETVELAEEVVVAGTLLAIEDVDTVDPVDDAEEPDEETLTEADVELVDAVPSLGAEETDEEADDDVAVVETADEDDEDEDPTSRRAPQTPFCTGAPTDDLR